MDYKIPTSLDIPAAIANALFDACGIRLDTMPITAEKVLKALKEKAARDAEAKKQADAGPDR